MKTATRLFTLSVLMLYGGLMADVNAQGRGREHHGGGNNGRDRHDNGGHDSHHDRRRHEVHHHDHHQAHVQHVYHHAHRDVYYRPTPPPRVVVVHHPPVRPRYIYYRDYDVYYDCNRSVYISYSGRGWTMSASVPVRLSRVDVHRASRVSVDYYEDDFPSYLDRGTPVYYGAVYTD